MATPETIQFWKPDMITDPDWDMRQSADDGYLYLCRVLDKRESMSVIVSGQVEEGKRWLHVSFARPDRMPDYDDIATVKRIFIGEDKKALMIFPAKKYHVNLHPYCLHPYCLHLWHCVDGDPLPEFSHGLGTL